MKRPNPHIIHIIIIGKDSHSAFDEEALPEGDLWRAGNRRGIYLERGGFIEGELLGAGSSVSSLLDAGSSVSGQVVEKSFRFVKTQPVVTILEKFQSTTDGDSVLNGYYYSTVLNGDSVLSVGFFSLKQQLQLNRKLLLPVESEVGPSSETLMSKHFSTKIQRIFIEMERCLKQVKINFPAYRLFNRKVRTFVSGEEIECGICYDTYEPPQAAILACCSQVLCADCCAEQINTFKKCPYCNHSPLAEAQCHLLSGEMDAAVKAAKMAKAAKETANQQKKQEDGQNGVASVKNEEDGDVKLLVEEEEDEDVEMSEGGHQYGGFENIGNPKILSRASVSLADIEYYFSDEEDDDYLQKDLHSLSADIDGGDDMSMAIPSADIHGNSKMEHELEGMSLLLLFI